MAMTAFWMFGEMSVSPSRMRCSLPVSLAIWVPRLSSASRVELRLARNSAWFVRFGRSLPTAIIMPHTVEIRASVSSPRRTSATRSFFSRGFG